MFLKIEFRNSTDRPYHCGNARLFVEDTGHYFSTIVNMPDMPIGKSSVQLLLEAKTGVASAATLPSAITAYLARDGCRLVDIECRMAGHWFSKFTGGLRKYCPADDDGLLNIALFGACGTGKSSMINTFLTLLSRDTSFKPLTRKSFVNKQLCTQAIIKPGILSCYF